VLVPKYEIGRPARPTTPRRQDRTDVAVGEIADVGGVVTDATWGDGVAWHAPETVIDGIVVRKKSGTPASHAVVSLVGTSDSVSTDSTGRFHFVVIPGKYELTAADTLLRDFASNRAIRATVVAERDKVTTIQIRVDELADMLARACRGQPVRDKTSVIVGGLKMTARQSPHLPANTHVIATWQAEFGIPSVIGVSVTERKVDSPVDERGRFLVCGVARRRPIHLQLALGDADALADTTIWVYDSTAVHPVVWPVRAP
jgi:hypothetical protein